MIITINGRFFYQTDLSSNSILLEMSSAQSLKDHIVNHIKKYHKAYLAAGYTLIMLSAPNPVLAATSGGMNLILLMQKASFWGGLGIASWGVIEMQLDYPGWKGRIFRAVGGYIVILLLPLAFLELQNNLQVDVWNQIQDSLQKPIQPR